MATAVNLQHSRKNKDNKKRRLYYQENQVVKCLSNMRGERGTIDKIVKLLGGRVGKLNMDILIQLSGSRLCHPLGEDNKPLLTHIALKK